MSENDVKKIKELLDSESIEYKVKEHEPVFTSEQAAKVRGTDIKVGVKALVLKKSDNSLILALIAANRKVNLKKLAEIVETGSLRLANPGEVQKSTECEVGSVHPFGLIHNLSTYMDRSVLENEFVEFNIGVHTKSIRMKSKDLVEVIKPVLESFSEV